MLMVEGMNIHIWVLALFLCWSWGGGSLPDL
jgi:hypothetical protein